MTVRALDITKGSADAGEVLGRPIFELTCDPAFIDGSHDIFDLLDIRFQSSKGDKKDNFSVLEVLNAARRTILAKDRRIKDLERLSFIDEPTGLYNKRGFVRFMERELSAVQRGVSSGGLVVFIDVENLEDIMRRHGRERSGTALSLFAKTLTSRIRKMDLTGYFGSGRFVLLFTNTNSSKAMERLQKAALMLNNLSFVSDGHEVSLTIALSLKPYDSQTTIDHFLNVAEVSH